MALDIMAAFTNEPPELDFIWPGFLAGTVGALVAPGATGKSFFALEAAMGFIIVVLLMFSHAHCKSNGMQPAAIHDTVH